MNNLIKTVLVLLVGAAFYKVGQEIQTEYDAEGMSKLRERLDNGKM